MKRYLVSFLIALALLAPSFASAAIAFDSSVDGGSVSGATSQSFSFTNTAGNIVFGCAFGGDGVDINPTATYGGNTMTLIGKIQTPTDHFVYLYYLTNPPTGANTMQYSWSGAHFFNGAALSYSGVNTSVPINASTTNTASAVTAVTTTLTTTVDNSWTILVSKNTVGVASASTGAHSVISNANGLSCMDSNVAITPAGSYSMRETVGGSSRWGVAMASFSPTATAPPITTYYNDEAIITN